LWKRLAAYDFVGLATDVIGYIYQRFLQETEQHRVGHYLTPPEVVDHILDAMEYVSITTNILGRDILDPACGSGSFLVHAAIRYRRALVPGHGDWTVERAESYLDALQTHFVGIDINPFSCHLARLNLLMLAVDALAVLEEAGRPISINEFRIHNADTLDFSAVTSHKDWTVSEPTDPITELKVNGAKRFFYVCGNPPVHQREE
jgi:type I restriction-modification system DNA methylase subunit